VLQKDWTIMVYMAGDNNLDQAVLNDIKEMEQVGSTPTLNLVVQLDRAKQNFNSDIRWETTRRYLIQKSDNPSSITSPQIQDLGETNTGDPQYLKDFAQWAIQNYPARNYMLIISSHGTGWKDWPEYKTAQSFNRAIFNHPSIVRNRQDRGVLLSSQADLVKSIANDDNAKDFLDNQELANALDSIKSSIPQNTTFSIVGFDACLMNTVEVLYQNRRSARFYIGSTETEPGEGWPYHIILKRFLTNTPPTDEQLARGIIEDIIAHFKRKAAEGEEKPVAISVLDTEKVEPLAGAVDNLGALLAKNLNDEIYIRLLLILKQDIQRFYEKSYIDLLHFALLVKDKIKVKGIAEACNDVIDGVKGVVYFEDHLSGQLANAHGITIYFPFQGLEDAFYTVYKKLEFSRDAPNWAGFLEKFHRFKMGSI